jgi:(1->4)-alpha-D-glucan 1-alpha-D-glucosylmutase
MTDSRPSPPVASYRVQFGPALGWDAAASLAPYLAALGISHLYASPVFAAQDDNTYATVDFGRFNPVLGDKPSRERYLRRLQQSGLREMLDLVPDHRAADPDRNLWWGHVLETGEESRYKMFFDIDYHAQDPRLRGRVLLPDPGSHPGDQLESGSIRRFRQEGRTRLASTEWLLQLSLKSEKVFAGVPAGAWGQTAEEDLDEVNRDPAALEALLDQQFYRLVFWKNAGHELNYRGFFDIQNLVGLCQEREEVFDLSHERVLHCFGEGVTDGVRIGHIDGLRDPQGYLDRIRALLPGGWIVVEKILGPGECLPSCWEADGSTGYDFLNLAGGLFVDPRGESRMTRFYAEFTGEPADFRPVLLRSKALLLDTRFGSELASFADRLLAICRGRRKTRDYARNALHEALRAVVIRLPVYRTYIRDADGSARETDAALWAQAIAAARAEESGLDGDILDFVEDLFSRGGWGPKENDFILRLQQFTGDVLAKGAEDTAFYNYNRLISLNESGGDPAAFGVSVTNFHQWCEVDAMQHPRSLLATSTHDAKRGEDVRLRISLLSEISQPWTEAVRRWAAMNERYKSGGFPDRNLEYAIYQILVGAWPLDRERLAAYALKAAREAKRHTDWTAPGEAYEKALTGFVGALMESAEFAGDLAAFVEPLIRPARVHSLSQTLLKLTAPGVPDFYQGSEFWDMSLVDPDNRREVDFGIRAEFLAQLEALSPEQILDRLDTGLPKLLLIRNGLRLRRQLPEVFENGSYNPLHIRGPKGIHALAFLRGDQVAVVAPRLVLSLGDDWEETAVELPGGAWRHVLTGDVFPSGFCSLSELFRRFPVALLRRES